MTIDDLIDQLIEQDDGIDVTRMPPPDTDVVPGEDLGMDIAPGIRQPVKKVKKRGWAERNPYALLGFEEDDPPTLRSHAINFTARVDGILDELVTKLMPALDVRKIEQRDLNAAIRKIANTPGAKEVGIGDTAVREAIALDLLDRLEKANLFDEETRQDLADELFSRL